MEKKNLTIHLKIWRQENTNLKGRFVNYTVNDVNPDIYESLSGPPVGEIEDMRAYRKKIDKTICTRGNIDLGVLHNGTPEDIETQVKKTLEDMKGFKHIVAGTCAVTIGTPLENIRTLGRTVDKLNCHFLP